MTKLYIMCGIAFSGKSTLARKIAEHTSSKIISFDKLWIEKDKEKRVPKNAEGWKYIRKIGREEVLASLTAGTSVVYDDNNVRKEHREEFRNVAKQAGASAIIIYLDTSLDIIRAREETNRTSQERHDVEPENFQTVLEQLEVPTQGESVLIFKPEDNIEDFVSKLG